MRRRNFIKTLTTLGAAVVVAPSLLKELSVSTEPAALISVDPGNKGLHVFYNCTELIDYENHLSKIRGRYKWTQIK